MGFWYLLCKVTATRAPPAELDRGPSTTTHPGSPPSLLWPTLPTLCTRGPQKHSRLTGSPGPEVDVGPSLQLQPKDVTGQFTGAANSPVSGSRTADLLRAAERGCARDRLTRGGVPATERGLGTQEPRAPGRQSPAFTWVLSQGGGWTARWT